LIFIILFVTLLTLSIGLLSFFLIARASFEEELQNTMVNTAKILADYSISPLEFSDKPRAAEILEKLDNEPQIVCAQIQNKSNETFAFYNETCDLPKSLEISYASAARFEGGFLHVVHPVVDGNHSFGRVYIKASTAQMNNKINQLLLGILGTMAGLIILAVLVTLRLQNVISKPISELNEATKKVSSGALNIRAKKASNDEVGELCEGFNYMLEQLEYRQVQEAKSKKALELSERKFRNIYENSMVGIFRCDAKSGNIIESNTKTWEILRMPAQPDMPVSKKIPLRQLVKLGKKVEQQEVIDGYELVLKGKHDDKTWLSVSGRLFREEGYFEGVVQDITEEKESFLELKRVNFELDNFVYHTSHDLRSPLLSIMGLINICKNEDTVDGIMNYFELIEKSVKRLDALVINLLTLSRNSRVNDKKQLVDFNKLIKESIEILNLSKPQNLEVTLHVDQEVDFLSDPTRLSIVFNNLISNAFKYYNPSVENPKVDIAMQVTEEEAIFKVKDNGLGIPKENQARIFQMFYRATDQSQGSGLGLYIVKNVVEKLKGSISFTSASRKGTTFVVKIPNALQG